MKKKPKTLEDQVKERLGEGRLAALSAQPACVAAGGIAKVLLAACEGCAGHPDPVTAASVRVIQMCGSQPKPTDLKP